MKLQRNNEVVIEGKIVEPCQLSHELYGEKFYEFKVEIPRLNNNSDILIVTISERLTDIKQLELNCIVKIEGQFRSYNSYSGKNGKLKLTIFAKNIKILKNLSQKTINKIRLNGFICKEPSYRTTPLKREICDIILAVNRFYNKSDYIPTISWGRNARFSKDLHVGTNIEIEGRIQSRIYEKKLPDGKSITRTAYEVSISKLKVVESN